MTTNKTKSKPQKHVVFTPVRWPVVWSQWIVELWKEKKRNLFGLDEVERIQTYE
jgi:hypothetical protein